MDRGGEWSEGWKFLAKAGAAATGVAVVPALHLGGWLAGFGVAATLVALLAFASNRGWTGDGQAALLFVVASLGFLAGINAFLPYSVKVEGSGTSVRCQDAMTVQGNLGGTEDKTPAEKACYARAKTRLTLAAIPGMILIIIAIPKGWISEE